MGRKGKRKTSNSNVKPNSKAGKGGKNNNGGKAKGPRKMKKSGGKMKFIMDIFTDEAMENAYYTCHNIMDVLRCRGFPWPEAQKKKKKGKK